MSHLKRKLLILTTLSGMGLNIGYATFQNSVYAAENEGAPPIQQVATAETTEPIKEKPEEYVKTPATEASLPEVVIPQQSLAVVNDSRGDPKPLAVVPQALVDHAVSFSANSDIFVQGANYTGTVTLANKDGNETEAGTTIVISLPAAGLDLDSLNLNDENLQKYFVVSFDKASGQLTLVLQKKLIGNSIISVKFGAIVKGTPGESYPVSVTAQGVNQVPAVVNNNSPKFSVKETGQPPAYGFLNAFWGIGPTEHGTYVGKSETDIEGLPTGIFNLSEDVIQNFAQINYSGGYQLPANAHYRFAWYIENVSGAGSTMIDPQEIKVVNDLTNEVIPTSWYTVSLDKDRPKQEVWVDFKSIEEIKALGGNAATNISFRVQLQAHVSNDSITYHTTAFNYILDDFGNTLKSYEFQLNNIFAPQGSSSLFPTLTSVKDKTFYVGELTDQNINEKLLAGIKAEDTEAGDISNLVTVDHSALDPNTVDDYQVTYRVMNHSGHSTEKQATIHIIDRPQAAPVTVRYTDEDDRDIIPAETITGKVGDGYTTTAKIFPGYSLLTSPENATGTLTANPQTVIYKYAGQLIFKSAPSEIDFGQHVLSPMDETYPIESFQGSLVVTDYRKIGSSWRMLARLSQDFTGVTSGKALGSTLFYIDKQGNKRVITTKDSTKIADHTTGQQQDTDLSADWLQPKAGLELTVPAGKALADQYQGVIEWTLEDGVPNS